jgi:hypothetical protein
MPRSVSALATASWTGAFNTFSVSGLAIASRGANVNDTEAGNECGAGER